VTQTQIKGHIRFSSVPELWHFTKVGHWRFWRSCAVESLQEMLHSVVGIVSVNAV